MYVCMLYTCIYVCLCVGMYIGNFILYVRVHFVVSKITYSILLQGSHTCDIFWEDGSLLINSSSVSSDPVVAAPQADGNDPCENYISLAGIKYQSQ